MNLHESSYTYHFYHISRKRTISHHILTWPIISYQEYKGAVSLAQAPPAEKKVTFLSSRYP